MCGLIGYVGGGRSAALERGLHALRHRGPDGSCAVTREAPSFGLAHARLAILDLSEASAQPMQRGGRLWGVFNGEIYNFRALRQELVARGHSFTSTGDAEVVLASYLEWGPACVSRFVGMFAVAIVDTAPPDGAPELFLCRDRLGIKPLVIAEAPNAVWFASELRALVAAGAVSPQLNHDSVLDYLSFGSVLQPATIFKDVMAVPPGTIVAYRGGRRTETRYWDLHESTRTLRSELRHISAAAAEERLREHLADAARHHLVSDVPVGAFLSGGVDSTLVLGEMTRASGAPVETFTVGFVDAPGANDERRYASLAASTHRAVHHEVVLGPTDAASAFEEIVAALDQPSIDGANTWFVSRATRKHVKVAVSGLGGDEVFAGYPHFNWVAQAGYRGRAWPALPPQWTEALFKRRPSAVTLMLLFRSLRPEERIASLRRLLSGPALAEAARPIWDDEYPERLLARLRAFVRTDGDGVQFATYAEVKTYLVSTLLRDVDAMSMAHGLEVRPMLLHHPLVEFAYALPAQMKLSFGRGKRVLTRAGAESVPRKIRDRKKRGFELPFSAWMSSSLSGRALDLLGTSEAREVFAPGYLAGTADAIKAGRAPREAWAWSVLVRWLQTRAQ